MHINNTQVPPEDRSPYLAKARENRAAYRLQNNQKDSRKKTSINTTATEFQGGMMSEETYPPASICSPMPHPSSAPFFPTSSSAEPLFKQPHPKTPLSAQYMQQQQMYQQQQQQYQQQQFDMFSRSASHENFAYNPQNSPHPQTSQPSDDFPTNSPYPSTPSPSHYNRQQQFMPSQLERSTSVETFKPTHLPPTSQQSPSRVQHSPHTSFIRQEAPQQPSPNRMVTPTSFSAYQRSVSNPFGGTDHFTPRPPSNLSFSPMYPRDSYTHPPTSSHDQFTRLKSPSYGAGNKQGFDLPDPTGNPSTSPIDPYSQPPMTPRGDFNPGNKGDFPVMPQDRHLMMQQGHHMRGFMPRLPPYEGVMEQKMMMGGMVRTPMDYNRFDFQQQQQQFNFQQQQMAGDGMYAPQQFVNRMGKMQQMNDNQMMQQLDLQQQMPFKQQHLDARLPYNQGNINDQTPLQPPLHQPTHQQPSTPHHQQIPLQQQQQQQQEQQKFNKTNQQAFTSPQKAVEVRSEKVDNKQKLETTTTTNTPDTPSTTLESNSESNKSFSSSNKLLQQNQQKPNPSQLQTNLSLLPPNIPPQQPNLPPQQQQPNIQQQQPNIQQQQSNLQQQPKLAQHHQQLAGNIPQQIPQQTNLQHLQQQQSIHQSLQKMQQQNLQHLQQQNMQQMQQNLQLQQQSNLQQPQLQQAFHTSPAHKHWPDFIG